MKDAFDKPIVKRHRPVKAAAALAHDIVDHIIDHKLVEGDRLPSEKAMIAETGRARGTLREALRLLESRGVVQIRQGVGGGPIVRRPRPSDLGDALTLLLTFEQGSIRDLIEARSEIEMLVIVRAAKRITPKQIDRLQQTVDVQRKAIADRDAFLAQSRAFHQIINEASGSVVLNLINQALIGTAHAVFLPFDYPVAHRKRVIASHVEIITAFREGNVAGACAAMENHIQQSADKWRRSAGPMADRPLRWNSMDRLD